MMRASSCVGHCMLSLLKLLQDGRFHSGEALGASLGVSRAAVWKQLQALEADYGVVLHRVRGRGYRLEQPVLLLDAKQINAAENAPGWPVSVLPTTDSTNAEAMRRLALESPPFAVTAERQTAGRGRRGRAWVSPFGENLYYSLVLRVDSGVAQLEGVSLVVGLAIAQAVRSFGVERVGLKWPNDVLVGGRKLAGILLELSGDPADVCHLIIGVGVNVNMSQGCQPIDQPWTSMRTELGVPVDRNCLAVVLGQQLEHYLALHSEVGFAGLMAEWEANHLWQGREVHLHAADNAIAGVVLGVNATGAIRLSVDGQERVFSGGELSLRLCDDS